MIGFNQIKCSSETWIGDMDSLWAVASHVSACFSESYRSTRPQLSTHPTTRDRAAWENTANSWDKGRIPQHYTFTEMKGATSAPSKKLELRNESRIWRPSIHTKIEACNRQLPIESDIRSSPWRKRSACHQGCRPSQNSWCSLETEPPQWWVNHTKRHQCADPCACHDFAWRYDPNLVAQRTGRLHREVSSPQWIIFFGSRIENKVVCKCAKLREN